MGCLLLGCNFDIHFPLADSYGAFLQVNEGEPVYDFCWYPCMSLSGEWWIAFCGMIMFVFFSLWSISEIKMFLLFCRPSHLCICKHQSWSPDTPLGCHQWGSKTGFSCLFCLVYVWLTSNSSYDASFWELQLRCTYRAYDSMDEITAALSISFNSAGSKYVWFTQTLSWIHVS